MFRCFLMDFKMLSCRSYNVEMLPNGTFHVLMLPVCFIMRRFFLTIVFICFLMNSKMLPNCINNVNCFLNF